MRINNNIMAMNTHRQYGINNSNVAKSVEKLSSGYRINRAGDDAAGLAISEKMRAQIRGLTMASKNSQDAISLVQTAEGALQETHNILQRMRELAVQSASDTNETTIDRDALNKEFQALIAEIDDTAAKAKFNDMGMIDGSFAGDGNNFIKVTQPTLPTGVVADVSGVTSLEDFTLEITVTDGVGISVSLNGGAAQTIAEGAASGSITLSNGLTLDFGDVTTVDSTAYGLTDGVAANYSFGVKAIVGKNFVVQTGANKSDELTINIDRMDADALFGKVAQEKYANTVAPVGIAEVNIDSRESASKSIEWVNNAINTVSTQRAALGALQNRLEHKIANLDTSAENLQAAESRIRDLDMAKEMTVFTKNNILSQAATAMLAQANSLPQGVLQLLQ